MLEASDGGALQVGLHVCWDSTSALKAMETCRLDFNSSARNAKITESQQVLTQASNGVRLR